MAPLFCNITQLIQAASMKSRSIQHNGTFRGRWPVLFLASAFILTLPFVAAVGGVEAGAGEAVEGLEAASIEYSTSTATGSKSESRGLSSGGQFFFFVTAGASYFVWCGSLQSTLFYRVSMQKKRMYPSVWLACQHHLICAHFHVLIFVCLALGTTDAWYFRSLYFYQ